MNKKLIELTQDDRSLIWRSQLSKHDPTKEDAEVFFAVCEEYGLNPLVGDIIFQMRKNYKTGERTASYVVTRDGHVKYAMRQKDFVKLISYVVCEGDHFEIDAIKGVPVHKFGAERGRKIGAWAMIEDRTRGYMAVFVDFDEYFQALKNNSVWDKMPSAMIKKVAQVEALRMAFPLGVHFRTEFEESEGVIDLNADMKGQADTATAPTATDSKSDDDLLFSEDELQKAKEAAERKKAAETPTEEKTKTKKSTKKNAAAKKAEAKVEAETTVKTEEPPAETQADTSSEQAEETKQTPITPEADTVETAEETQPVEPPVAAEPKPQPEPEADAPTEEAPKDAEPVDLTAEEPQADQKEQVDMPLFILRKTDVRQSKKGEKILVVIAEQNGEPVRLFAKEPTVIDGLDMLGDNEAFLGRVVEENNFSLLKDIRPAL